MEKIIEIKHLSKSFGDHKVLKDIDFSVNKGEVVCIIGSSGSGKSTLLRCVNLLEKPTGGEIIYNGENILDDKHDIYKYRTKLGMVFQQFNLFDSKTVYENIAFPLEISGYKKENIRERVEEILDLVELSEKRDSYPLQLSGGQKQRVGIARALANEPDVLLSDEATSALDPQTTYSILELLRSINKKLNLTIVIITHELDVLRYATNNMVVLENGQIVEVGSTESLFLNPKSDTLKNFISITESFNKNKSFVGGEGI